MEAGQKKDSGKTLAVRGKKPHRKKSDKISLPSARTLWGAINMAREIGSPLTLFTTIHWSLAKSATVEPFDRIGLLLDRYKAWAYRLKIAPAFCYARERQSSPVEHVHFLFHVPAKHQAAFKVALARWVQRESDLDIEDGAIDVKSVRNGTTHNIVRYLLKGGDALVRRTYSVTGTPAQGRIAGKRTGVSHNIGAAAQKQRQVEIQEVELVA